MRPEFVPPASDAGALAKKSVTSPFKKEEDPNEKPSPFRNTRDCSRVRNGAKHSHIFSRCASDVRHRQLRLIAISTNSDRHNREQRKNARATLSSLLGCIGFIGSSPWNLVLRQSHPETSA